MIIDNKLETRTWGMRVGKDIGGVPPTSYGFRVHPLDPPIREFYIDQPAWANWLGYVPRPILPNTGKLSLQFDLYVDENAASVAQAIEFDTKMAIDGTMYDFSSQFNYVTGIWQVSGPTPGWKNTTFQFGKFPADVLCPVQFDYSFDIATKKFSFVRVRAAGKAYEAPSTIQNFNATPSIWKDTCNLQVQQDLNANGGAFSIYLRNIRYVWA